MKIYSITYYLKENHSSCSCNDEHHHHHRDDYPVTGNIKALGAWAHVMPTTYLVKSEKSSEEILNILNDFIEEGDIILVSSIDATNVSSTINNVVEWINS